ncbi:MAG: ParB N-terminal domain-containing protein [Kiritimatiellia bacterium]
MANIKYIPVGMIETEGLQIREKVDPDVVADYGNAMTAGKKLPPVLVYYDGHSYYLVDGFHRLQAAQRLNVAKIACDVRDGTFIDARLAACAANQEHGLRRSNADKRRAVAVVLELRPDWSNRMIAEHVGVHHDMVGERRQVADSATSNVRNPRQSNNFGPPPTAERRIGADGKFYPASGCRPPVPVQPASPATPGSASDCVACDEPAGTGNDAAPVPTTEGGGDDAPAAETAGDGPSLVDSLGRHVPEELAPLWHRRQEVQDILTAVSRVRSTIRQAQEGQDPLWAEANFSALMAQLDRVYAEVDATKPYVVCPMCQGIGCRVCKERGLLGKYRYDMVIPRELKFKAKLDVLV